MVVVIVVIVVVVVVAVVTSSSSSSSNNSGTTGFGGKRKRERKPTRVSFLVRNHVRIGFPAGRNGLLEESAIRTGGRGR